MNKTKFFSSLLVVALFATASVVTSCKDYDDDIKNLQSQIDGINKTLSQIQTLISSGSVITDVKTLTDGTGGVEIFLSNNKSYKIYNGADGEDGADGAKGDKGDKGDTGAAGADGVAPVVTIGDNGNWFINGVDTGKPSRGETGATGATGAQGPQGEKGEKGDKGEAGVAGAKAVYYVPGTEGAEKGFWVKVDPNTDPETRTVTTEKWVGVDPNMVSAVMDKETGLLTLVNVKGAADTDEYGNVVLSLNNALRSLVLIPTTVLSSSKAILVDEMIYNVYSLKDGNKAGETLNPVTRFKVNNANVQNDTICPLTKVQYHVNPSNADINKVKDAMVFQLQNNVPWGEDNSDLTRAKSSKDLAVAIKSDMTEFDSETGILTVYLDLDGTPATFYESAALGEDDDYVSMVALQVAKENGEFVTSDYGTLAQRKNLGLAIANQTLYENHGEDYHFRSLVDGTGTAVKTISAASYTYASDKVKDQKVWETGNVQDAAKVDTVIYYTRNAADGTLIAETLNVKDLVGLHMVAADNPNKCHGDVIAWRNYGGERKAYTVKDDYDVIDAEDLGKVFPGWTLNYELVTDYKIGNNGTDQAEYVKFDAATGILSINETYGSSAINRTPIIRVTLKDENKMVVNVAYIKVKIVERGGEPLEGLSLTMKNVGFKCAGNMVQNDYKEISKDVYDVVHLTKAEFHATYPNFDGRNNATYTITWKDVNNHAKGVTAVNYAAPSADYEPPYPDNVGSVEQVIETDGTQQTTHTLIWVFSPEELWENAGKTVSHVVSYYAGTPTDRTNEIEIKLTTTITGLQKEFNITTARYISEYWTDGFEFAKFNVNVPPSVGYFQSDKTLFQNDMNSPFIAWPTGSKSDDNYVLDGYIRLLDSSNKDVKSVTSLDYKFHNSIEGEHTFNGVVYYFRVSQTGDSLLAAKKDAYGGNMPRSVADVKWNKATDVDNAATNKTHVIAIITNDIAAPTAGNPWPNGGRNKVELQETSAWAKAMLNSKELKVNLTVKGYVCDDEDKVVKITFDGKDYYTASYIRPLNEPAESNGNFIDGVDFGEAGSYLNVMDIVQLKDWRGRVFGMPSYGVGDDVVPAGDYWNYWLNNQTGTALGGYYGLQSITLVSGNKCDLNGTKQDIPATIQVNQTATDPAPTAVKPAGPFGYITYKNNGTTVTGNYNLYLKFKVTYKWGEFITEEIKVPVAKTTVSPAPKF